MPFTCLFYYVPSSSGFNQNGIKDPPNLLDIRQLMPCFAYLQPSSSPDSFLNHQICPFWFDAHAKALPGRPVEERIKDVHAIAFSDDGRGHARARDFALFRNLNMIGAVRVALMRKGPYSSNARSLAIPSWHLLAREGRS
ncbi:hypothetical protein BASA62_001184 [Batrachochytrium salamandrivorans]|nr:hypothetical protein BASA62_001184 [Batrachochytrium salamandrivorans]